MPNSYQISNKKLSQRIVPTNVSKSRSPITATLASIDEASQESSDEDLRLKTESDGPKIRLLKKRSSNSRKKNATPRKKNPIAQGSQTAKANQRNLKSDHPSAMRLLPIPPETFTSADDGIYEFIDSQPSIPTSKEPLRFQTATSKQSNQPSQSQTGEYEFIHKPSRLKSPPISSRVSTSVPSKQQSQSQYGVYEFIDKPSHLNSPQSQYGVYEFIDKPSHLKSSQSQYGVYEFIDKPSHLNSSQSQYGVYEFIDKPSHLKIPPIASRVSTSAPSMQQSQSQYGVYEFIDNESSILAPKQSASLRTATSRISNQPSQIDNNREYSIEDTFQLHSPEKTVSYRIIKTSRPSQIEDREYSITYQTSHFNYPPPTTPRLFTSTPSNQPSQRNIDENQFISSHTFKDGEYSKIKKQNLFKSPPLHPRLFTPTGTPLTGTSETNHSEYDFANNEPSIETPKKSFRFIPATPKRSNQASQEEDDDYEFLDNFRCDRTSALALPQSDSDVYESSVNQPSIAGKFKNYRPTPVPSIQASQEDCDVYGSIGSELNETAASIAPVLSIPNLIDNRNLTNYLENFQWRIELPEMPEGYSESDFQCEVTDVIQSMIKDQYNPSQQSLKKLHAATILFYKRSYFADPDIYNPDINPQHSTNVKKILKTLKPNKSESLNNISQKLAKQRVKANVIMSIYKYYLRFPFQKSNQNQNIIPTESVRELANHNKNFQMQNNLWAWVRAVKTEMRKLPHKNACVLANAIFMTKMICEINHRFSHQPFHVFANMAHILCADSEKDSMVLITVCDIIRAYIAADFNE